MRGVVKFTLGKIERESKVSLGLAPEFEEACGMGVIPLSTDAVAFRLKLVHAAEIVRIALKANGVHYSRTEVLDMAQHEGPVHLVECAARILNELFARPEGVATAKPGNGRKARTAPAASH